jgi:hypothetical protein
MTLLAFPQSWDGGSIRVRFLCVPKGSPLDPLQAGVPAFANANMAYRAMLISGLDQLPASAAGVSSGKLTLEDSVAQKAGLFTELTKHFKIKPPEALRLKLQFRKAITESYRALVGDRAHSQFLVDGKEYECQLHTAAADQPAKPAVIDHRLPWGRLIGHILRQPKLAKAVGLSVEAVVPGATPDFFAKGGWLYIDLDPTSDYAGTPGIAARYAARIPALTKAPRTLFAPILFPVDSPGTLGDDIFEEAELYEDGFAKLVHCAQGENGDSIQIAWDDEQLGTWFDRQTDRKDNHDLTTDAPNGIAGYRVDVRLAGDRDWNSLLQIKSMGDLQLGPFSLGPYQGESAVEVAPAQISPKQTGVFWLPSYFATWRGSSLALTDPDITNLHSRPGVAGADTPPHLADREQTFEPVDDKAVPLRYGNTYEFRVRMADLTRGGPNSDDASPQPPRHSIASLTFQRRKAPGQILVVAPPAKGLPILRIAKPRLGHPEALFTGRANFSHLVADLNFLAANPGVTREVSVPDPDVLSVEIAVSVRALAGDVAAYLPLYTTTREFVGTEISIALDFQNHATLAAIAENQPDSGSLLLPTARDVRLTLTAMGRSDAGYFFNEAARRGAPVTVDVRSAADVEEPLLGDVDDGLDLRSFFFQPIPAGGGVAPPIERLAKELKLDQAALHLSAPAGDRLVFSCAASLKHTISPDGAGIGFSSGADLLHRWISVLKFDLLRDWTWDGLQPGSMRVTRIVHYPSGPSETEIAGNIELPRSLNEKARPSAIPPDARAAVRQFSRLLFFDAFDPKPTLALDAADPSPRKFPSEITIEYKVEYVFNGGAAPGTVTRSILLPITTPPTQTPKLLSAGIALSEYERSDDYSSTGERKRSLWLEFAEPPIDPDDAYFVRILGYGSDPMLVELSVNVQQPQPPPPFPQLPPPPEPVEAIEPPLAIDPEWMRSIVPGQPRDKNGFFSMLMLDEPPKAPTHYLIPLPETLDENSPELFGFFTYEIRVGHTTARWSTAQGRFGPALRIAGVQHPAPQLLCQAERNDVRILLRAPFATPFADGKNLRPAVPKTAMWGLLYARVRQTDAASWRNVLLLRTALAVPHAGNNPDDAGRPVLYGEGQFDLAAVGGALRTLGLPTDAPLTALAAELFTHPAEADGLGERLGHQRILRISTLTPVPDAC